MGGGGLSLFGAVFTSEEGSSSAAFGGAATAGGAATSATAGGGALFLFGVASAGGGADSKRGAGTDSRRGFGGGARRRDVVGGGTEPFGGIPLPGRLAGGGIGELRMSGRPPGTPGGLLGVPTETTGTLGILAGGGMLSELVLALASGVSLSAVTSASSMVEDSGFDVMRV